MSDQRPADLPDPTGHYGPGYADPTGPLTQKDDASTTENGATPAETPPPLGDIGSDVPDEAAASVPEHPVFTSEDVGVRPPDRAPTEDAPASEQAGLIFERS